jgi:hypothetical protein
MNYKLVYIATLDDQKICVLIHLLVINVKICGLVARHSCKLPNEPCNDGYVLLPTHL